MPFCPNCKYEYVEGIKTCSDCGVELVDELSPEKEEEQEESTEWVIITNVWAMHEAKMISELLESSNVPARIRSYLSEVFTVVYPKGIDILVPKDYEEQGKEIINAFLSEEADTESMNENKADADFEKMQEIETEESRTDSNFKRTMIIAAVIILVYILIRIILFGPFKVP